MLLPFAEWRIFYLPLQGRKLGIDWTGYRSASAFDLVYFFFLICLLPSVWKFIKEKRFGNFYLLFWVPALVLILVLYAYLRPKLPFLTPSQRNVIDVRHFIIHFSIIVSVAVYLSLEPIGKLIRWSYVFYSAMVSFFAVLSILALWEFSYFYYHYPFVSPFTLSFPFPNQNVAAVYISICVLGLVGTATVMDKPSLILVGIPIGVFAAAMTGSRSNMVILVLTLFTYWLIWLAWICGNQRDAMRVLARFGIAAAAGLMVTLGVVAANYDWQPVRRSLSLFPFMVSDPLGLLLGNVDIPRREMWRMAMAGERGEEERGTEKYKLYILSVEKGKIVRSEEIRGLRTGKKYYMRLSVNGQGNSPKKSVLEVFSDGERRDAAGKVSLNGVPTGLKSLFLFVSDTGSRRGLVTISVSLDNYQFIGLHHKERFNFSHDEGLTWKEEWYTEQYGDSKGVLRSDKQRLDLIADEQAIRGYVERDDIKGLESQRYVLEYEMAMNHLQGVDPAEGPARFYIGFHSGGQSDLTRQWYKIRNGLLIGHERIVTEQEERIMHGKRLLIISQPDEPDEVLKTTKVRKIVKDVDEVKIETLWDSPITYDNMGEARSYDFGGKVGKGGAISVMPDESWSAQRHLANRGSTHNVYLDWFYYVGELPAALFYLFVLLLISEYTIFLWIQRRSVHFPFYLATGFQLIVIGGSWYAHPGIWVKYIWFTFGIAGAIMLLRKSDESVESWSLSKKGVCPTC